MLRKEQTFLLKVLADHLNGRKTQAEENLDWGRVCSYARYHEVTAILYAQCAKQIGAAETRSFSARRLFEASKREEQLGGLYAALAEEKIPHLICKGVEVACFYPQPKLRSMGDTDLLVHKEDKERVHTVMERLGFKTVRPRTGDHEWEYAKDFCAVELHHRLLYDEAMNEASHVAFTDRVWDYALPDENAESMRYHLDVSFHFIYVLLHLRKHFVYSGVGFRQFMDLAVMQRSGKLDWAWIGQELEALGLTEFAKNCFAFCERWFDIPFPMKAELGESFFLEGTEKIFENGVFGETSDEVIGSNLLSLRRDEKFYRLKSAVEVVFPGYEKLRKTRDYAFVDGKPWLLPAAWVYRFFFAVLHGRTKTAVNDATKLYAVKNSENEAQRSALQKWGL